MMSLVLVALLGCGSKGDDKIDDNLVRVVEKGDLIDEVAESGKIAPAFKVDIKSKVSGEIASVAVQEGQAIHKGDLLYSIVDIDYSRNVMLNKVAVGKAKLAVENAEVERDRRAQAL